jgi:hypothetical protein
MTINQRWGESIRRNIHESFGDIDRNALREIAEAVENGEDEKKIWNMIWRLDTIVRDQIPDDVYCYYRNLRLSYR